jgi:hypothetical protein
MLRLACIYRLKKSRPSGLSSAYSAGVVVERRIESAAARHIEISGGCPI